MARTTKRSPFAVRTSRSGAVAATVSDATQVVITVGSIPGSNLTRDFVLFVQDGLLVITDGQRRISGVDLNLAGDGPARIVSSQEPHKEGR
jgi:hypothetical protein